MTSVRLDIQTRARCELVDITAQVRSALRRAGLDQGAVLVYSPHTTAGVVIQENADHNVRRDLMLALANAVPDQPPGDQWLHAEGNSPAHVKSALVGVSQLVPVEGGDLELGTWQAVFLCELDGPRLRRVLLRFLKDA
ncbi:MAG TPA: secondary thiamine-phosphate synthase enzyme YjbQ [Anaeromyxobacteraceae bacterium]|nr:secondary thiamine-phosphate synthase enzyme YjbQ [Anaeromyxobacteraceae bacterium]